MRRCLTHWRLRCVRCRDSTSRLTRVEWFGDSVVWLAPEPDAPFRALTAAVWNRFPEVLPYGGAHSDNVPHLTLGSGGPMERMRQAAEDVREQLPIHTSVEMDFDALSRKHQIDFLE